MRDVAVVQYEFEAVGAPDGPHIALVTLGCDKNTVDSERILASLVGHGARVSSDVRRADILIVNTCGFIQDAKEQSIETILDACDLKARGTAECCRSSRVPCAALQDGTRARDS